VNLERPVTLLTRLGGHLVQGHVDGVGRVAGLHEAEGGRELEIELPADLARYVVEKGSIAVDGVSLTVTGSKDDRFGVAVIPHTLAVTTLGTTAVGDSVNLEVDVMAKYVEGLLRWRP
jgi:riboflavin synthase